MEQRDPFQIVADICQQTGAKVIVIGGHALSAYGHDRLTHDVDFVIDENDLETLKNALDKNDYPEMLKSNVVARFGDPDKGDIIIDLMLVDSETFQKIKEQAKEYTFNGQKFLVPKLDYLIALKLHALKEQFHVRKIKDLPDIIVLARQNNIDLNGESFKSLCLKFGGPKVYEEILRLGNING